MPPQQRTQMGSQPSSKISGALQRALSMANGPTKLIFRVGGWPKRIACTPMSPTAKVERLPTTVEKIVPLGERASQDVGQLRQDAPHSFWRHVFGLNQTVWPVAPTLLKGPPGLSAPMSPLRIPPQEGCSRFPARHTKQIARSGKQPEFFCCRNMRSGALRRCRTPRHSSQRYN